MPEQHTNPAQKRRTVVVAIVSSFIFVGTLLTFSITDRNERKKIDRINGLDSAAQNITQRMRQAIDDKQMTVGDKASHKVPTFLEGGPSSRLTGTLVTLLTRNACGRIIWSIRDDGGHPYEISIPDRDWLCPEEYKTFSTTAHAPPQNN